jgi:hypothetical protein
VLPACDRALEICRLDAFFQSDTNLLRSLRLKRGTALRHLGRFTKAGPDIAAALGLPPRDPQTGTNLIDLSAFYNGGGGQDFAKGLQHLAGTDFDLRGWIHLDLRLVWPQRTDLPERVDGIPIQQTCQRLHFLHTATLASHLAPGYWNFPESTPDDPALVVAWTGVAAPSRPHDATTRLYKQTWENPRPDAPIRSVDFIHTRTHAVPILVAITAEP